MIKGDLITILILGFAGLVFLVTVVIIGANFLVHSSPNGGRAKYYKPIARRGRMPCQSSGGAYPTHTPSRWEITQVETFTIDTREVKIEQAQRLWLQTESDRQPAIRVEKPEQKGLPEPHPLIERGRTVINRQVQVKRVR